MIHYLTLPRWHRKTNYCLTIKGVPNGIRERGLYVPFFYDALLISATVKTIIATEIATPTTNANISM